MVMSCFGFGFTTCLIVDGGDLAKFYQLHIDNMMQLNGLQTILDGRGIYIPLKSLHDDPYVYINNFVSDTSANDNT